MKLPMPNHDAERTLAQFVKERRLSRNEAQSGLENEAR